MATAMEHFQQQFLDENVNYHDKLRAFEQVVPKTFHAFYQSNMYTFLRTIFSKEQLQLLDEVLALMTQLPYAQTYYRRSYRAPFALDMHYARLFDVLVEIHKGQIGNIYDVFDSSGDTQYVDDRMMYVDHDKQPIISTTLFSYVVALQLNARDEKVEDIIRDILWKNGAHRHYSRELVRGIFMSQHSEMHQLVADVLLAAKNQEGVRQTITETIDEGTLTAQLTMMQVIIEHHLLRFSSIARAVDVWFGLGYDVTDERQLRYVLETSYDALQHDDKIEALVNSNSSLDVFIGLWSLGTKNIEHALMCIDDLFTREDYIQQTTLYALRNMNLPQSYYEPFIPYILQTNNLHTFAYGFYLAVQQLPYAYYQKDNDVLADIQRFFFAHPWLAYRADEWLAKVEQFLAEARTETITIEQQPFPFLSYTLPTLELFKLQLLLAAYQKQEQKLINIASMLKDKPVEYREYFYTFIPTYLERYDLLLPALKDRGTGVRLKAMRTLKAVQYPLEQFEHIVPSLLTLKSGELRMAVIELLQAQPVEKIEALAATLITHKKEQVRLGIIELLVQMKDELEHDWTATIAEPTVNEAKLLKQLVHEEETFLHTPPGDITYMLPLQERLSFTFYDFVAYDFKRINEKLHPLRQLLATYAQHAYETETYYGEHFTTVIGEHLQTDATKKETIGSIDHLPLAELWVDSVIQSELTAADICCYLYAKKVAGSYFRGVLTKSGQAFLKKYVTSEQMAQFSLFDDELYESQLYTIMQYTVAGGTAPLQQKLNNYAHSLSLDYVQFCSSMLLHFAEQELAQPLEESALTYRDRYYEHYDMYFFSAAFFEMSAYAKSAEQVQQLFHTLTQFYDELDDMLEYVNLNGLLIAFEHGIVNEHFLRHVFISRKFRYVLTLRKEVRAQIEASIKRDEVLALIHSLTYFIVEQELNRGDIETAVTGAVHSIEKIEGVDYFIRILKALDGEKLSRQWMYSVQARKDSLSTLLLKVEISEDENREQLFRKLRAAAFSNERLIEAMLYNSKLIPLLSAFIGWEGLEEAAWYFIAHTSESTTDYETAKLMEYSEVAPQDFERGAFDRDWFLRATSKLTAAQFKAVYAAAKYATSGSNHRRAQLYAQATLGELHAEELKAEISLKRNKDKLRAYSLIPATLQQAKERYVFFQAFLKESRQFGAQRRASEAEAVDMAIQNLAQQVSSGNTTQFIWLMEQQRFAELQPYFTPVQIDDVQLQLVQQQEKIELVVHKGSKQLKSVPKKIAKHETVLAMIDAKKELTEQTRRIKQQLEQAMCEEIPFDSTILYTLSQVDAFAGVLEKLVWYADKQLYYVKNGQFYTLAGDMQQLDGALYIAHPVHLYETGQWRQWQHFVFTAQWQQPFKQVFRELYVVTDDERGNVYTNRLEGYQIQPTKAIALLKARGWKAGYYEPVRKISYRYHYITHIDFVYDAYTPADIEAPTLADIYFEKRLTGEKEKLGDVPAVHFSEILRDLDLVVSVAHAGEVDPEASHSTIDMRAAIVEEMVQLFQLSNVEVKAPHIFIKGELADYTIHLGSGNVHQLGGAMIPVMAIPSQHRGRVFLPFIDEDPKTAEISAKLLLFADDAAINDPQIRRAIR